MYDILQLSDMLVPELRDIAQRMGITGFRRLAKQDLIYKILDTQAVSSEKSNAEEEPAKPARPNPPVAGGTQPTIGIRRPSTSHFVGRKATVTKREIQ